MNYHMFVILHAIKLFILKLICCCVYTYLPLLLLLLLPIYWFWMLRVCVCVYFDLFSLLLLFFFIVAKKKFPYRWLVNSHGYESMPQYWILFVSFYFWLYVAKKKSNLQCFRFVYKMELKWKYNKWKIDTRSNAYRNIYRKQRPQ